VALAAGARAGYLWTCCDRGHAAGPLRVQDPWPAVPGENGRTELDELRDSVRENYTFRSHAPLSAGAEPTAHVAPGYPWALGLLRRVVDTDEKSFAGTVRWAQCGLGALTAGLYFLFARRAFGSLLVATLTGVFCALNPYWVINTAEINDGVLASFLLGAALFCGARGVQTGGPFASLLYGLLLAGLALVRAALLPFAFVAVVWFLLRSRAVPRGWLCATLAFLGFANGLVPWTVRNWQLFKEPVPVVNSAYYHLWEGNHRNATGGPAPESDMRPALLNELQGKPQAKRYTELSEIVWDEVARDSLGAVKRRLWAGLYFFFGERWFRDGGLADRVADAESPEWLERSYPGALAGTLLGMLLLGVLGWRWAYGWRAWAMPASLAVMWVPLPYILSHAESLAGPRLPLDGVLLCLAAFALACFVPGHSAWLLAGARPAAVRPEPPGR
jgi:hypothetical protein